MQIIVRGHKLKITPAIREHAQKKMQKLERFFNNIQEVIVELEVQHVRNKAERQIVHVTVNLSQGVLRADEADPDIYIALDKVFTKVEKQVQKHHAKLKTRREAMKHRLDLKSDSAYSGKVKKSGGRTVVASGPNAGNPIKPMDPQEAVLELQMSKSDFFIFKNPINDTFNVLYTGDNGRYGLYHTTPKVKLNFFQRLFGAKVDPTCGEKAITNVSEVGKTKVLAARILTILNQK